MSREFSPGEAKQDDETAESLEMLRALRPGLESALMRFYEAYKGRSADSDHALLKIELQVTMFQYELVRELELLFAHGAEGFAFAVAAKGLIHRLVEFEKHLGEVTIPAMLELAQAKGAVTFASRVRQLQREGRPELAAIRKWRQLRNKATGHYDEDLDLVMELLEDIDLDKIRGAAHGFLVFMLKVMVVLREAIAEAK
ncbi:TPA: hypothetical protein QDB07_001831 [Burkholderia vietnamiensis]|nr:hypothetical protein [Burkholderia vietnamiensis]